MVKVKKTNFLLLLIITCITTNCKQDMEILSFHHFDRKADTINVDFSLNNIDFIHSLENKYRINLCEDTYKLGKFELENSIYVFPLIINKDCNDGVLIHNIIDIISNESNQTLVDSELVNSNENLKNEIFRHTKERLDSKNYNGLFYNFNWGVGLGEVANKKNLVEVLKGIDLVLEYKSMELLGKPLRSLSKKELESLNAKFYAIILIVEYAPIINIPPPSMEIN
ncbi:hypothetical protein Celal_1398 [Cellulophaga algicola DSM 14237]|uniref:Uncharacterized protein n=1 Tax=Cellulophaga algicola (strain DSM 14237 / IC166 / ACAM 630) TaxID=688270 RepID=E6X8W6_CELAD|nr:hypothetical protein [Cellulophaga algicola]ADV48711.1 hypothetical protein Celal_1398 [Cellulophaga algicola DSM 14237]